MRGNTFIQNKKSFNPKPEKLQSKPQKLQSKPVNASFNPKIEKLQSKPANVHEKRQSKLKTCIQTLIISGLVHTEIKIPRSIINRV